MIGSYDTLIAMFLVCTSAKWVNMYIVQQATMKPSNALKSFMHFCKLKWIIMSLFYVLYIIQAYILFVFLKLKFEELWHILFECFLSSSEGSWLRHCNIRDSGRLHAELWLAFLQTQFIFIFHCGGQMSNLY